MVWTGGCQCGAVRFRVEGEPKRASICHCRMCQKAMAAPFGAFATFPAEAVSWTRGARKIFLSSEHVARGFCGDCGTPLTFEAAAGGDSISLTVCAFDDPSGLTPERQIKAADRIAWVDTLAEIPRRSDEDEAAAAARHPPVVSRQHPDHDTETWPPTAQ